MRPQPMTRVRNQPGPAPGPRGRGIEHLFYIDIAVRVWYIETRKDMRGG